MLHFVIDWLIDCILYVFSPSFNFDFLTTSQEIGSEEHLRYDLFSVEWDIKPELVQISPFYQQSGSPN